MGVRRRAAVASAVIAGLTGVVLAVVVLSAPSPATADGTPPSDVPVAPAEPEPSSRTTELPAVQVVPIPPVGQVSQPAALLGDGTAVGFDYLDERYRVPWAFNVRPGLRRLSTPAGDASLTIAAEGWAAGAARENGGAEVPVRWNLADGSFRRLDPAPGTYPAAYPVGVNAAGDVAVTTRAPTAGGGAGRIAVVPVTGRAIDLGPSSNAFGLSARRETMLYRAAADGTPRWFLAGPRRSERLPWTDTPDCFVPVNEAGFLAYQPDPSGLRPARLRELDGTWQKTRLFVDCTAAVLSPNGRLVGVMAPAREHVGVFFRGKLTDVGVPGGGREPYPKAVNAAGDVLTQFYDASGHAQLAVKWKGQWVTLPVPEAFVSVTGVGLNDAGQVLGSYQTPDDQVKSLLWQVGS